MKRFLKRNFIVLTVGTALLCAALNDCFSKNCDNSCEVK